MTEQAQVESSATPEEIEAFRSEVRKYIETGSSTVLTASERVSLQRTRQDYVNSQKPWYQRHWESVSSLWKN